MSDVSLDSDVPLFPHTDALLRAAWGVVLSFMREKWPTKRVYRSETLLELDDNPDNFCPLIGMSGVKRTHFVVPDPAHAMKLQEVFGERGRVVCRDVLAYVRGRPRSFDLIILTCERPLTMDTARFLQQVAQLGLKQDGLLAVRLRDTQEGPDAETAREIQQLFGDQLNVDDLRDVMRGSSAMAAILMHVAATRIARVYIESAVGLERDRSTSFICMGQVARGGVNVADPLSRYFTPKQAWDHQVSWLIDVLTEMPDGEKCLSQLVYSFGLELLSAAAQKSGRPLIIARPPDNFREEVFL